MSAEEIQPGLLGGIAGGLDDLLLRNTELEKENKRLRLALAILQFKQQPKQRGRPLKHTPEDKERFLQKVEFLCSHFGEPNPPALCRRLNKEKPPAERLARTELESQIKTIQNLLTEAKRLRK